MQNSCGRLLSEAPDSTVHLGVKTSNPGSSGALLCLSIYIRSWTPRWLCEITPTVFLWFEKRFIFISFTLTMTWKEKSCDSWVPSLLQCVARDFSKDGKVFLVLSTCFSCLFSVGFTWEHITKRLRMSVSPDFNCCHFVIFGFPSCELSHLSTYYPESIVPFLLYLLLWAKCMFAKFKLPLPEKLEVWCMKVAIQLQGSPENSTQVVEINILGKPCNHVVSRSTPAGNQSIISPSWCLQYEIWEQIIC